MTARGRDAAAASKHPNVTDHPGAQRRPCEAMAEGASVGDPRVIVRSLLTCATVGQPEQRLMRAVLEDALLLVVGKPAGSGGSRLVAEASDWVAADDWLHPFSFLNVCDALGLDAGRVRLRLAPWLIGPRSHPHQRPWSRAGEPVPFACGALSA